MISNPVDKLHVETGGLLRIGIKLMMACCTANIDVCVRLSRLSLANQTHHTRNYVPLVNLIGVFFQIRDDLMNLQSTEVVTLCHILPRSPFLTALLLTVYIK